MASLFTPSFPSLTDPTMKKSLLILATTAAVLPTASAALVNFEIAGNSTGYFALANVKNWATEPEAANTDNTVMPYFYDPDFQQTSGSGSETTGVYKSITVSGLSSTNDYSAITPYEVKGAALTQPDFASFSVGRISYDNSLLTNTGTENISVSNITLDLNTNTSVYTNEGGWAHDATGSSNFSVYGSEYNKGGGFGNSGWSYYLTASNLQGSGLTFVDGVLTSIDFTADIGVKVAFGNASAFAWKDVVWDEANGKYVVDPTAGDAVYEGALSFSGDSYAFDLDETKAVNGLLQVFQDTRMVITREGTISAVSPVPEPSAAALAALGLFAALRRRR